MSNHAPFVPWMHSLLDRMKELYNKPNARTIAEALPDITGALHYRGTKATVADLPSSGNATGDVWHITADGSEWAWDGSDWQDLGSAVDLSAYRTAAEQDAIDSTKSTKPSIVTVSGTTPTITPAPNTIYNCGEVASLTISNQPATGEYSIVFTSGSTPTDLSIDPDIKMPDGFTVEANKRYEINVSNRWAVVGSWAVVRA